MSSSEDNDERTIAGLTHAVVEFAHARDWTQFHNPKNLTMALAAEVGELSSILRWVGGEDSDAFLTAGDHRDDLMDEIGDIGICLLLLCARVNVDFSAAVIDKVRKNAVKYPLAASRGRAEPPER